MKILSTLWAAISGLFRKKKPQCRVTAQVRSPAQARASWSYGDGCLHRSYADRERLTEYELELVGSGLCPDCEHKGFLAGPRGGMSQNFKCSDPSSPTPRNEGITEDPKRERSIPVRCRTGA